MYQERKEQQEEEERIRLEEEEEKNRREAEKKERKGFPGFFPAKTYGPILRTVYKLVKYF